MTQYKDIIDDYLKMWPKDVTLNYRDMIGNYNFTNDIPKQKVFIKLNPDITQERREQIADGIRAYFRDDTTLLLDKKTALDSINSSLQLFQIFNGLVGGIALILAFFLLLISTTQNVRENIWEYGALRAMGYSKQQGMRAFMYEQYSVIISSLILGSFVGFVVATVVTAQFFLFLELPLAVEFPLGLVYAMFTMAFTTTFFAVWVPVTDVNEQMVAQTLKGLASNWNIIKNIIKWN